MRVDIVSDVVCPWCAVGYWQLATAAREEGLDLEVHWHPFQLNPFVGPDGENLREHLARKYGQTPEQSVQARARLTQLGAEVGFTFNFTEDTRTWNTFDAHRLLHLARLRGRQIELKHRLGRAYFTDGEPIGETDTLRRAALDVGLDADEVEAVLTGDAFADEVRADIDAARQIGIAGVPFFVVDGRLGVSGAQPADSLLEILDQGWLTREPTAVSVVAEGDACGPDGCEI